MSHYYSHVSQWLIPTGISCKHCIYITSTSSYYLLFILTLTNILLLGARLKGHWQIQLYTNTANTAPVKVALLSQLCTEQSQTKKKKAPINAVILCIYCITQISGSPPWRTSGRKAGILTRDSLLNNLALQVLQQRSTVCCSCIAVHVCLHLWRRKPLPNVPPRTNKIITPSPITVTACYGLWGCRPLEMNHSQVHQI